MEPRAWTSRALRGPPGAAPVLAVALALLVERGLLGHPVAPGFFWLALASGSLALLGVAARGLGLELTLGHGLATALATLLGLAALLRPPDALLGAGALVVLAGSTLAFLLEARRAARVASGEPTPGRRAAALALGLLALGLLAPLPIVRAAAIALALLGLARARERRTLSPDAVALLVLGLALAAFGIPAWAKHDGGLARLLDLGILVAGASVWAWAAARPLELEPAEQAPLWPAALALLAALALHAGPLEAPAPSGGDEGFHRSRLEQAIDLGARLELQGLVALLVLFALAAALLALATRRLAPARRLVLVPGGSLVLVAALALGAGLWRTDPGKLGFFLRYSPFELWPQALLALAPVAAEWPALGYAEGWNRLLPLAATLALALGVARRAPLPPAGRLLAALAFLTIPNVRSYATLLYLEMPFVAAMTLVLWDLARERPRDGLPRGLAFLALLAVPLTKEAALPFFGLACVFAVASAWLERPRASALRALGRTALLFLPPIVLLQAFRYNPVRTFEPHVALLLDPDTYRVLGRALPEQYGAILLLAPVGVARAWRRGRRDLALFCLALLGGYTVSMAIDGGFCLFLSRFTLVLLPPLVVLASEALGAARARWWLPVLGLGLAANLAQSPVGLRGEREPFWGCYRAPQEEIVYPWDEALAPLAPLGSGATIEVLGQEGAGEYPFERYRRKYAASLPVHVVPCGPELALEAFARERGPGLAAGDLPALARLRADLEAALEARPAAAIVQLPPGDLASAWPARVRGYEAREYRLGRCRLLVYARAEGP